VDGLVAGWMDGWVGECMYVCKYFKKFVRLVLHSATRINTLTAILS
jgi:hypothetical protein